MKHILARPPVDAHEPIGGIADRRRFHDGIFVGIDRRTGQYMLHDGTSVKLARTVMRVPTNEKWNKEMLVKVGCTPYDLHEAGARSDLQGECREHGGAADEGHPGSSGMRQR